MKSRTFLDTAVSVAVLIAALATAGRAVWSSRTGPVARQQVALAPVLVDDWRSLISSGRQLLNDSAAVQMVVFSDFECPYCARFHQRLMKVSDSLKIPIGLTIVHYPLSMHRFALPSARMFECTDTPAEALRLADALFAKQDSLGLLSWEKIAVSAAAGRPERLAACALDTAQVEAVLQGQRAGDKLSVRGTPTVLVNGWRFPSPPFEQLPEVLVEIATTGTLKSRTGNVR